MGGLAGGMTDQSTFVDPQPVTLEDADGIPIGSPIDAAAADVHAPAVNTAAVVTYGAVAGERHYITGVAWSYIGGIPVDGNLLITDAGATVFEIDVNDEGPGAFYFNPPKRSAAVNTIMVITLAAGGAAITGKVSIPGHESK